MINSLLTKFSHSRRFRPLWDILYKLFDPIVKTGYLSRSPALYLWFARHVKPDTFWVAPDKFTDLLIEGVGGSATHSLVAYVEKHNPDLNIAHACEVPATVIYCVQNGIPAIVPVRNVIDVVSSVVDRFSHAAPRNIFREYLNFYRTAWSLRDRVVIADFAETISNPAGIIARCNKLYGVNFNPGDNKLPHIRKTWIDPV